MEVSELMVGDLVLSGNMPAKVVCVSSVGEDTTCIVQYASCVTVHSDNEEALLNGATKLEYLKPIPLAQEILENNGWKRDDLFMTFDMENIELAWTDRCGAALYKNGHHLCDCDYLHQLQHALKLCKIDKNIEL